jgi:hypothetical protein
MIEPNDDNETTEVERDVDTTEEERYLELYRNHDEGC